MALKTNQLLNGYIIQIYKNNNYNIDIITEVIKKYYVEDVQFVKLETGVKLENDAKRAIIIHSDEYEPGLKTRCSNFVCRTQGNLIHKWMFKINKVPEKKYLSQIDIYTPWQPQIQLYVLLKDPESNTLGNYRIGGPEKHYDDSDDYDDYCHTLDAIEEELTEEEEPIQQELEFVNEKGEVVEPITEGDIVEVCFVFKSSGKTSGWVNVNGKRSGKKFILPDYGFRDKIYEYTPCWWSKRVGVTISIIDYHTMCSV